MWKVRTRPVRSPMQVGYERPHHAPVPGTGQTRPTPAATPDASLPDGEREIVLHAKSVTKRFGGLVAVNKADLIIPKGSIVSLIGPNGAGKTTFFNIVAGILDPTSGVVEFNGRRMIARPERTWLEPFVWLAPAILAFRSAASPGCWWIPATSRSGCSP